MKVLLLGATGNVGSRVLASLLVHGHEPILYLRSPDKLPASLLPKVPAQNIITGSATDVAKIKAAILDNNCEAVITAAGLAGIFSKTDTFPAIFRAIAEAAAAAGKEREKPMRTWFMAGFSALDMPDKIIARKGQMLLGYVPLFPDHAGNYEFLKTMSTDLDWSTLCASQMAPAKIPDLLDAAKQTRAESSKIIASADIPPEWTNTLAWVPLIGAYLNAFANAGRYATTLEQTAEAIVRDLDNSSSPYSRRRVGIIYKQ